MKRARRAALLLATGAFLGASLPAPDGDPVALARAQRAAALSVPESDLPPVPRGIVEPPPLPPPEIHPKDLRGRRGARRTAKPSSRKGAKGKAGTTHHRRPRKPAKKAK